MISVTWQMPLLHRWPFSFLEKFKLSFYRLNLVNPFILSVPFWHSPESIKNVGIRVFSGSIKSKNWEEMGHTQIEINFTRTETLKWFIKSRQTNKQTNRKKTKQNSLFRDIFLFYTLRMGMKEDSNF